MGHYVLKELTENTKFPLKFYLVNVNKPAVICGFAHIYESVQFKNSFWANLFVSLKNLNGKMLNDNNQSPCELLVQEKPGLLLKFLNFQEAPALVNIRQLSIVTIK